MKKQITKALAIALSATLFIQPITAFAVEEAPAEVRVEAPAPAPQMNDAVEAKVEAAEAAVEAALPPAEVKQEDTDKYLEEANENLEIIDQCIEALDALNDEAAEAKAEYKEDCQNAIEASGEIAANSGAVSDQVFWGGEFIATTDAIVATYEANKVEDLAGDFETKAEADAAKEEATGYAEIAEAAAQQAEGIVADLQVKMDAAAEAKETAEDELAAAELALQAANEATEKAQEELDALMERFGADSRLYPYYTEYVAKGEAKKAIDAAKAALKKAQDAQEDAEDTYNSKKGEYDDAKDAYDTAKEELDQAIADRDAYQAIANDLALADLINYVNGVEATERDTFNANSGHHGDKNAIKREDQKLAEALLKFTLRDKPNLNVELIGQGYGASNFKITYTDEDGNEVEEYYYYSVDKGTHIVDGHKSTHWLVLGKHGDRTWSYAELDYYRNDRNMQSQAAIEAGKLDEKINNTDLSGLEEAMNSAASVKDEAYTAFEEASSKKAAVDTAYDKVLDAAKALKNLKAESDASAWDLRVAQGAYNYACAMYDKAQRDYNRVATMAGIARYQADRAWALIDDGFNYPQPRPNPNPNPNPGPTEPSEDVTPYVAPVVTNAPVAEEEPAAPQAAVLGETRGRGTGAAVEEEAIGDGEEKIEDGEGEKKIEEEEKKDEAVKPAVTINDEDTARAAAPIAEKKGFPWWILIILAIIVAVSIEEYNRRKNKEENIQE